MAEHWLEKGKITNSVNFRSKYTEYIVFLDIAKTICIIPAMFLPNLLVKKTNKNSIHNRKEV